MKSLAAVAVFVITLTSCGPRVAPDNRGQSEPEEPDAAEIGKTEPAFRLTAEEFHSQASDVKFKGRVIELSGTVNSVQRNISGEAFVSLEVPGQPLGVACFTAESQPWAVVAPGQWVRIKGMWAPVIGAPRVLHCTFVETGDYTAIRISAVDLAWEYVADAEATVSKYAKKHLVITGEVRAIEVNRAGAVGLVLRTGNKVPVNCGFAAFDKDVAKAYAVGQTVTVFGQFLTSFANSDSVEINFCLPLTAK